MNLQPASSIIHCGSSAVAGRQQHPVGLKTTPLVGPHDSSARPRQRSRPRSRTNSITDAFDTGGNYISINMTGIRSARAVVGGQVLLSVRRSPDPIATELDKPIVGHRLARFLRVSSLSMQTVGCVLLGILKAVAYLEITWGSGADLLK